MESPTSEVQAIVTDFKKLPGFNQKDWEIAKPMVMELQKGGLSSIAEQLQSAKNFQELIDVLRMGMKTIRQAEEPREPETVSQRARRITSSGLKSD